MKIIIEPENKEEGERQEFTEVVEFCLVGYGFKNKLTYFDIQRLHTSKQRYNMIGKLYEAIERLRNP